jgi:thiol-disulfide isomerase/thioredoxin
MKLIFSLSIFLTFLLANTSLAQEVVVYDKFDDFQNAEIIDDNTVFVINFWATWCAPCIKELPYFEKLHTENKNVKVVLASLDSKKDLESKLIPFIKKKKITAKVVLLSDKDYNTWLSKVDENWSGAIPATILIQGNRKLFAEREFENFSELNEYINSFINLNK